MSKSRTKQPAQKSSSLSPKTTATDPSCTGGWWCHGRGRATTFVPISRGPSHLLCKGCDEQALEATSIYAAALGGPCGQIEFYARARAGKVRDWPALLSKMMRERYEGPDARMIREKQDRTLAALEKVLERSERAGIQAAPSDERPDADEVAASPASESPQNPHRVGSRRFRIFEELREEPDGLDEHKLMRRVGADNLQKLHETAKKTSRIKWQFNATECRVYYFVRD